MGITLECTIHFRTEKRPIQEAHNSHTLGSDAISLREAEQAVQTVRCREHRRRKSCQSQRSQRVAGSAGQPAGWCVDCECLSTILYLGKLFCNDISTPFLQ